LSTINVNNRLNQIQNNTDQINNEQNRKNLGSSKLDRDAFLQLLMAQLRHQDPINPVDNKEFLAQQAAFTQIEKMDELTRQISQGNQLAQASNLVGKQVIVGNGNDTITGRVDSALIGKDGVEISVGGNRYPVSNIQQVLADN
jgi:flagellar basal-body rod modification protein FlgD